MFAENALCFRIDPHVADHVQTADAAAALSIFSVVSRNKVGAQN